MVKILEIFETKISGTFRNTFVPKLNPFWRAGHIYELQLHVSYNFKLACDTKT